MIATQRIVRAVLGAVLFAAAAVAQSMTVTPNPLRSGGAASISYTNAAKANSTVTVFVTGGFPVPTTQEVVIQLDAQGHGVGTWQVANWRSATFSAAGVGDIVVDIN